MHLPRRRTNLTLTSLLVLALAASAPVFAGIIELGLKGQKAGGSTFQVVIEGTVFTEGSHVVGEDVASIPQKARANIAPRPLYLATPPDPNNNPTLITVSRRRGGDPVSISIFIQDPNIGGTFVDQNAS